MLPGPGSCPGLDGPGRPAPIAGTPELDLIRHYCRLDAGAVSRSGRGRAGSRAGRSVTRGRLDFVPSVHNLEPLFHESLDLEISLRALAADVWLILSTAKSPRETIPTSSSRWFSTGIRRI